MPESRRSESAVAPSCGCPDECVHGHNGTRIERPQNSVMVNAAALLAALPDGVTRGQVRAAILGLEGQHASAVEPYPNIFFVEGSVLGRRPEED